MDNYHEAWRIIKKCAEKGINDAVIWDHYGDIALALSNKKDASHGYARALALKPDNSIEIRTKLERLK
jgi:predicted negative regulator of RcsB-dependent stress response